MKIKQQSFIFVQSNNSVSLPYKYNISDLYYLGNPHLFDEKEKPSPSILSEYRPAEKYFGKRMKIYFDLCQGLIQGGGPGVQTPPFPYTNTSICFVNFTPQFSRIVQFISKLL